MTSVASWSGRACRLWWSSAPPGGTERRQSWGSSRIGREVPVPVVLNILYRLEEEIQELAAQLEQQPELRQGSRALLFDIQQLKAEVLLALIPNSKSWHCNKEMIFSRENRRYMQVPREPEFLLRFLRARSHRLQEAR